MNLSKCPFLQGESLRGEIDRGFITVDISHTIQTVWGLDKLALESVLVGYAREYLSSKAGDSFDIGDGELKLKTSNAPDSPPFRHAMVSFPLPTEFEFILLEKEAKEEITHTDLASDVIDLRDNINAILGEKFGGRLLTLNQERALLDLSRSCNSIEELTYRVSALSGLAKAIDT
jgi:hypothetical protein